MSNFIAHNKPTIGQSELDAITRVMDSKYMAQGPEVEAFEAELCEFFGLPTGHAVLVSSGSSALYLALWALDGNKSRIGLPVYSCAALRNAVGLLGGYPVYIDCAADSPNLCISSCEVLDLDILVAPSIFGLPINLPESRTYKVVEDLAQSIGAETNGKPIGIRGEVGICSFYATKMITSGGQGGAVISRDRSLIEKIKDYRNFDCRNDSLLRFNFQITDIQASVGRVQLRRLPEFIKRREEIFSIYEELGLNLISQDYGKAVRYRAIIKCTNPLHVIRALENEKITSIVPVEYHELLDDGMHYPFSTYLTRNTFSLPIYPSLKNEDAYRIGKIVKDSI